MYIDQRKICAFFTQDIFTCGHNTTVRSESTNSQIKGSSEFKKDLKDSSLIDCVERFVGVFGGIEQKALNMLHKHVKDGDEWSKFVDSH